MVLGAANQSDGGIASRKGEELLCLEKCSEHIKYPMLGRPSEHKGAVENCHKSDLLNTFGRFYKRKLLFTKDTTKFSNLKDSQ